MATSQIRSFRDLIVWQRSMDLAVDVHRLTNTSSPRFRFSLSEQMNRAAISVPSNIAEGVGRHGRGEFRHYVSIALGSLRELGRHLLLGTRVDAFSSKDAAAALLLAAEIGRMLTRLGNRLR